jgi:cytochrome c
MAYLGNLNEKECAEVLAQGPQRAGQTEANGALMTLDRARHPTLQLGKTLGLALCLAASAGSAQAVDTAAAEATARQNNCFKCHGVEKKKDGPSYQEVAAKYKGKADAETRLTTHLTTGEKAKFPDGHEEEHKIVKVKDPAELKNLVGWILSR